MNQYEQLKTYYNQRALVYEKVYEKPERQADITQLKTQLRELLKDQTVLEVACGTGYWTQIFSETATHVFAVDQSQETLAIARAKSYLRNNVGFVKDDAYSLNTVAGAYSAGFAGFWWSHIRKSKLQSFLRVFHSKLSPGASVVFTDNQYVEGSNHPITTSDSEGNTYQERQLPDGSTHLVLKNFPSDKELQAALKPFTTDLEIKRLEYFWLLRYKLLI